MNKIHRASHLEVSLQTHGIIFSSGWGVVRPPSGSPNTLQKLEGTPRSDEVMKRIWKNKYWPGMIGFGTFSESACMGDSGGPLVCPSKSRPGQYDLVGVVSWGYHKCRYKPSVFTEVAHYLDWIERYMKD